VLPALFVAVLAVALGAALTAASGARPVVLGLLRTFAATAAAAVVLTHLLPDALGSVGLWGGLSFLVGLLGPLALHPLTERLASRNVSLSKSRLALEAGFIGLLVHHVGDGLGIGAYAALPGGVLGHLDVILALIAHTVPLVAVVTLAYRKEYDLRVAFRRAGALGAASALGVLGSFAIPAATLASLAGWIGALVSGVLLHVVTHDWLEDLPRSEGAKLADLAAAALGLSLVLLGGHEHAHDGGRELLEVAQRTAQAGAPPLLVAVLLTFLLGDSVERELEKLGHSLPVELTRRIGFALGAEGLALGLSTYGVAWTLAAALATTVVPIVAGAVAMLAIAIAGEAAAKRAALRLSQSPLPKPDRWRRFDRATAIWIAAVALSAVLTLSLPDGALYGTLGGPSELFVSGLLGSVLGSGGPSVVALGSLTDKGLSPGAALLGVALSSALGAQVLRGFWQQLGGRGLLPVWIWLACLTGAIGIGINQVAPVRHALHFPSVVGRPALAVLLTLIVVRAERVGVRKWLAGWFAHAHGEYHLHADHADHAHSSEMPNGSAATKRSPDASGPSAEA
jgi:hypothetical protein